MKPADLIAHAERLTSATQHRPRQVDLKRAVSAAYYAMFHALAKECADTIVGAGAERNEQAWLQVYRALEHGMAKNACRQAKNRNLGAGIVKFATRFASMQDERHTADYDPTSTYSRSDVLALISEATVAIGDLAATPRPDRRAFVAVVLLRETRR